jgi:protein SCO1/2
VAVRPVLRSLLASVAIFAAGLATLAVITDGLRAFTSETARRIAVRTHPRVLPAASLQTSNGQIIELASLRGRWLLVDFIYTRCLTYCSAQGGEFSRLQDRLAKPIGQGKVVLLSISFDPTHDGPAEMAAYQRRSGDRGAGWIAARPTEEQGLAALMRGFGVKAVPDGIGGFVHNAAIAVVDPQGRLVAILDPGDPRAAAREVSKRLGA